MSLRDSLLIAVLLIGAAGCANSPTQADGIVTVTQTTSTTTTSIIPDIGDGTISATPSGVGLVGATLFTFSLASPPTGGVKPYTFAWEFGDGGAAAGEAVQHQYLDPGDFTVKVTVHDSTDKSKVLTAPVGVRGVSGRWTVTFAGAMSSKSLDLVQSGASVTGAMNHTSDGPGAGTGSVANPKSMSLSLTFASALPTPYVATFVGKLDERLVTWTGTVTGFPACPCVFEATR